MSSWTRAEFLALCKERAHEALKTSGSMAAAMSLLGDFEGAQGTDHEIYPKGHVAYQHLLNITHSCSKADIDGFV